MNSTCLWRSGLLKSCQIGRALAPTTGSTTSPTPAALKSLSQPCLPPMTLKSWEMRPRRGRPLLRACSLVPLLPAHCPQGYCFLITLSTQRVLCRYTRLTYLDDAPPSAGTLDTNCTLNFALFYNNNLVRSVADASTTLQLSV